MSKATAIAEAKKLQAIMRKHGVTAVIELKPGRPWSGDDWYTPKHALMNHHTAGPKSGLTPSLDVCRNGRPGLEGPLCNGYGGRDLVYRIITMGLANHPGEGGPLTVAGFTIPKDSARPSVWGTEWEHDGVSPWPTKMRDFMARANAAIIEWRNIPIGRSIEHSTWAPKRKIDRNTYTAKKGQDEILSYLRNFNLEDDMTPEQEAKLDFIYNRVQYLDTKSSDIDEHVARALMVKHPLEDKMVPLPQAIWSTWSYTFESFKLMSDPAAFAAKLAPLLQGKTDEVSVEQAIRKVFGELDGATPK